MRIRDWGGRQNFYPQWQQFWGAMRAKSYLYSATPKIFRTLSVLSPEEYQLQMIVNLAQTYNANRQRLSINNSGH